MGVTDGLDSPQENLVLGDCGTLISLGVGESAYSVNSVEYGVWESV